MRKSLKTLGLCALAALAIVSCKKNDEQAATMSFEATINQPTSGTRTGINEINGEKYMTWNNGDVIKVFAEDGTAANFTTTNEGETVANFTGQIKDSESYCAFYPADNASNASGDTVTLTLSTNQTFKNGSFSANTYPIAAKSNESDKTKFEFCSPCGLLAIPVKGTGTLGSIELTGNKTGEKLAGTYIYDMNGTMTAPVGYTEDANATKVTLTCEGGLELNPNTPATMYFVLPDGALSEGFSIHLKDTKGNTLPADHVATNNPQTIGYQSIRTMSEPVTVSGMEVHTPECQPSDIGSTSIKMTGSYGDVPAGMTVTEVGFYYREATEPESANVKVKAELANKLANNSFTYTLIGLESDVEYTYRSYVVVSGDQGGTESTGAEQTVTTNTPVSAEVPTLTTADVTVSGTEATVGGTITNVGGGTIVAGGCGIRYKSGTDDWTYVALTPENNAFSTTLTGLAENTTYTVQAYATTNEAGTGYGSEVTFTTELHGVESFTVDFENGLPEGWTTIDADGDGYNWVLDTQAASAYGYDQSNAGFNGGHMILSGSYHKTAGALHPDNYLVSPKVTLRSGSTFSFWAGAQDYQYPAEHFGVCVSDNGTSDWTMVQEWTMEAKGASGDKGFGRDGNTRDQGRWYYFSVDLSAYAGQRYIAIRHFDCSDQFFLNVDNIRLGDPEPTGTSFSQNFNNSVLPEGWTTIDADGDGYNWVLTTQTSAYGYSGHNDGHYGTVGMTSGSYHGSAGALTPDNYLVTPKVNLVQGSTFSFWACAQDADYPAEHFGVYVSDNGTSGWTMVQEWTMTAKGASGNKGNGRDGNTRDIGNWYQYTVDLSAYAGEKYIAIRHFNCSDEFFLEIDDILLTVNR